MDDLRFLSFCETLVKRPWPPEHNDVAYAYLGRVIGRVSQAQREAPKGSKQKYVHAGILLRYLRGCFHQPINLKNRRGLSKDWWNLPGASSDWDD